MAVDILRDEPKAENKDLRLWGIQIINQYSGIQLTKELKDDLLARTSFPPDKMKFARRLIIKSVPRELASEITKLLFDSGAIKVNELMEYGEIKEISAIIPDEVFQSVSRQVSEILKRGKQEAPK